MIAFIVSHGTLVSSRGLTRVIDDGDDDDDSMGFSESGGDGDDVLRYGDWLRTIHGAIVQWIVL